MSIIFLDTETTGLDPTVHGVIEVAWSVDGGPISTLVFPHSHLIPTADVRALEVNNYYDRGLGLLPVATDDEVLDFFNVLKGNTICGANIVFDANFLTAYYKISQAQAPWNYRMLDIEAFAAGVLCQSGQKMMGLWTIGQFLLEIGYEIPEPRHTAESDVACLIACYQSLRVIQEMHSVLPV